MTRKGRKSKSSLTKKSEETRKINSLLYDAIDYFQRHHDLNYSIEEAEKLILSFVNDNLKFCEIFINPDLGILESTGLAKSSNDSRLLEYLTHIGQNVPIMFDIFRDIVCGSILSTIFYKQKFSDRQKIFEPTLVLLDSNFIFNLFDLSPEEFAKPSKELFSMLKSFGNIKFRIFDITINEIKRTLSHFPSESHKYPKGIKINSIYSNLRNKGWSFTKVKEFTNKFEEKLEEDGIEILQTDIVLSKFKPAEGDRGILATYKPKQYKIAQNHDFAVIREITKLRGVKKRLLEECRFFFLTSDKKLAQFNYNENEHRYNNTVSEVIPESLLTNLLWLKNPNVASELHLRSLIALQYRQIYIEQDVWEEFFKTVLDLRKKNTIDEKDISILIYDKHFQELLRNKNIEEISTIEEAWICGNIEKAKENYDVEKQSLAEKKYSEIQKLRDDYQELLITEKKQFDEIAEGLKKRQRTVLIKAKNRDKRIAILEDKIKSLRNKEKNRQDVFTRILTKRCRVKAKQSAEAITKKIKILGAILISAIGIYSIPIVIKHWNKIEPLNWIITICVTILFIFGVLSKKRLFLFEKISNTIEKKIYFKYYSEEIEKPLNRNR